MTPDEFRQHGHDLIDWIADQLAASNAGEQRVLPDIAPGDIRAQLPEHPPAEPEPWADVMRDLDEIIVPGLTQWQHPGFFAWFPSNITYPSILGELAAAGLGVNAMAWATSPAATELETLMLDWMHELLDLPAHFRSTSERGGGSIQGTASEATLVAMLAARWRSTGGAINTDGDTTNLVGYSTAEAHSSIEKGFRIAGFGTHRMRHVPVDANFAMRPDALRELVKSDPFIVRVSLGDTARPADHHVLQCCQLRSVSSIRNRRRLLAIGELQDFFDKFRIRIGVDRVSEDGDFELDPVRLGRGPSSIDKRVRILSGHMSEVDRADALRRCDVDRLRVVVDADVPAHDGRVKLVLTPVRAGFEFVVDRFHLDEIRNHREVGVQTFPRAGMRSLALRCGSQSDDAFVGIDDFQQRRLADDGVRVTADHFLEQVALLGHLSRSAVTDLFIRRAGDVNRLL